MAVKRPPHTQPVSKASRLGRINRPAEPMTEDHGCVGGLAIWHFKPWNAFRLWGSGLSHGVPLIVKVHGAIGGVHANTR